MEVITSRNNDRVKFLCKLHDRNKRDRYGLFLIEGVRELTRALKHKYSSIVSVFFCEDFFKSDAAYKLVDIAKKSDFEVFALTREVFQKISNRENCDGVLALAKFWKMEEPKLGQNPLILVAEGIEKAGNLGALIRSAESVGVDLMILCEPVTDIFNPNVVRASQGAVFSLPILILDKDETFNFLVEHRINVFITTPTAKKLYFKCDFTRPSAIIVGAEHDGLSNFWLNNADLEHIVLPQMGKSDSLNVNDAAVVVLYEALRQRIS